jgi:hypothetical protein
LRVRLARWAIAVLDDILSSIAATLIVGAITIALARWQGPLLATIVRQGPRMTIPLATGLLVVIAIAVVIRRKTGISFIQPVLSPHGHRARLDLRKLALSQYIEPDRALVDNTHRFERISQTFTIAGHDGSFVLRYTGRNESKNISTCFRDSVVGDSPIDIDKMDIKAVDKSTGAALQWRVLRDDPYEKMVEVDYRAPLRPHERFDIEWSCDWPGAFSRAEDYVFFPLHYYQKGVEEFRGTLIMDTPPKYVEGVRLRVFPWLRRLHTTAAPVAPLVRRRGKGYRVTWTVSRPTDIYLLQYGR